MTAESEERVATTPFVRITAANTLFFLCFASFFLLPVWMKQLGADEIQIGLVMTAGPLASMVMMPLTGSLIDRWGRRRPFLLFGYLGMATVAFAFSWIDGLELGPLLVLRLLSGVFFGCAFTAANIFVADVVPASKLGQGIGLFGAFILVSHMLGPTLAEPLAARFGFPVVFGASGLLPLLALGVLPTEGSVPRHSVEGSSGPWRPLSHVGFRAVMILTLAAGAGFGAVLTYVPAFAEGREIRPVSTFFIAYALAAIAVRLFGGRVADVRPRVRVIGPTLIGFVLALVLVPWMTNWPSMAAVGAIFGFSHGLMYPTACALALERVGEGERGSAMALYNLGFNVGGIVTTLLAGALIEQLGYARAFPLVAVGIGLVGVGFVRRERRALRRGAS